MKPYLVCLNQNLMSELLIDNLVQINTYDLKEMNN